MKKIKQFFKKGIFLNMHIYLITAIIGICTVIAVVLLSK